MSRRDSEPITTDRWLANILVVLEMIADKDQQERRWRAPDVLPWESPDELINSLGDVVFDGFLETFGEVFSPLQRQAAFGLKNELSSYCGATPQSIDREDALDDPRWHEVRCHAATFIAAFRGNGFPIS